MFAKVKLRRANRPSGSIGLGARCSHQTKAAKNAMPAMSGTKIAGEPHPRRGSSISAKTGPPSPRTHSDAPTTSTRGFVSGGGRLGTA
jgi:hypothetical protein